MVTLVEFCNMLASQVPFSEKVSALTGADAEELKVWMLSSDLTSNSLISPSMVPIE